nr:hypothetical protein [Tanacetum cinerariifolium]
AKIHHLQLVAKAQEDAPIGRHVAQAVDGPGGRVELRDGRQGRPSSQRIYLGGRKRRLLLAQVRLGFGGAQRHHQAHLLRQKIVLL